MKNIKGEIYVTICVFVLVIVTVFSVAHPSGSSLSIVGTGHSVASMVTSVTSDSTIPISG